MRLALALTLLLFAGGPAHSHVQGPDSTAAPAVHPFYRIQVVDRATGRGVPLIELRTTYGGRYLTDSAGVVAFFEPGLMGEELWFHVAGHGYEHPADGFGYRGVRLTPTRGGRATITVDRINLAERLYRMTGTGIYRDSVLVGDTPNSVYDGLVSSSRITQSGDLERRVRDQGRSAMDARVFALACGTWGPQTFVRRLGGRQLG